jgi:hypothetical protein
VLTLDSCPAHLVSSSRKVDEAFWEKFQLVSAGKKVAVKSCYEK